MKYRGPQQGVWIFNVIAHLIGQVGKNVCFCLCIVACTADGVWLLVST